MVPLIFLLRNCNIVRITVNFHKKLYHGLSLTNNSIFMVVRTCVKWFSLTFPGFPDHKLEKFPDFFARESVLTDSVIKQCMNGITCKELHRKQYYTIKFFGGK